MAEIEREVMTDDMESNLARNESRRIIGLPISRNRFYIGRNRLKNYLDEEEEEEEEEAEEEERELLNELQSFFEWHPRKNHLYNYAHQHRMTFYHQRTKDDDHFICCACNFPIEYAMYGCPECGTIWLHKSCAELPREIKKHPFHTQHSLVHYPEMSKDQIRKCSGCDLPLGNRGFYGCTECMIFFHKFCLELPREIRHIRHPSHPLSLEQEFGKKFSCSACSADHTGLNYSCKRGDYNLGIRCIIKEATKRDGNSKGHILTFLRKQPSEHRKSVYLVCRRRFNLQLPVFHCKECKFSLHRDCVLPVVLPLLPDTFPSKKHPDHPLTLTNYNDPDFNIWWQVCDVCDQCIPPHSSFYYCRDCDFAEDLTCVLSELCWSLAHKKVDQVELDVVPIVIDNPPLTVKGIIKSLKSLEDMEELNELVKAAIRKGVWTTRKLIEDQPFRQILQVFESKFGDKRFGLSYCQTQFQVTETNGLDFKIPINLVPICNILVDPEKSCLNYHEDRVKSSTGKTFIFTILCAAMYSFWTAEDFTAKQLFTHWDCFQIAKIAGFEIEIAFDRLSKEMHAYLGLADTNFSVPNQGFDKKMKQIRSVMEKLQYTRTQLEAFMLVGYKDDRSKDTIKIEILGENSWDESKEVTSEQEVEDEEDEDEQEEEEELGESSLDESSEVGSEEEDTPPGEISEQQENDLANARDHQESPGDILKPEAKVGEEKPSEMLEPREQKQQQAISEPSEILTPDTKVGEEKSSEMPELREQKQQQAISIPPDPWDCNEKENLEKPADRIRHFNERHLMSESRSFCNHRLRLSPSGKKKFSTSNSQISNKDGVKDEKNLCTACELPFLQGKNETFKYCSRCKIFLHQFCDKYPPEIRHQLRVLHPLKLKVDREKKEIKCNVCEEKCRGCAYYCCEACEFYLEARCLFQEPTVQSKCHGNVFRLPLEQSIKQNPRGCFACGKKIIPGFSSDFLRCRPCNVNLHVNCPIPSSIIRSFHSHPLYFIPSSLGSQCDSCKKKMERSFRPSYACQVCHRFFHMECATSNIM